MSFSVNTLHVSSRDLMLGLLVVLVWAGNAVVIKYITFDIPPMTGLAVRLALGSIVFLPFLRFISWAQFKFIALVALFMAVFHWASLIWAIDRLDVSSASILMQTQVIFAVLLGRFFFAEDFGWRTASGILLGVIGVAILVGLPQSPPAMSGVIGIVFSMLFVAIAYAFMKHVEGVSAVNYLAYMHILALPSIAAMAFLFEAPMDVAWDALDYKFLGGLFFYQVIIVAGAHVLWQRLMTRNGLSVLPNLTMLIPIFGVVLAMVFLDERLTLAMVGGGALTMVGVGIILWRKQVKQLGD